MAKYMKTEKGYQEIEVINSNKMDKNNPVGTGSFSMGRKAGTTVGDYSHAEGSDTTASGPSSHAEGSDTTASGPSSHAEGYSTKAYGGSSHAEGASTTASGEDSHAEGFNTIASYNYSHAEGHNTKASGSSSHAEGYRTTASGYASHAEGNNTTASGEDSHAEGFHTTATSIYQHSQGKYNIEDTLNKYAHIVGNGEDGTSRSNAHTLDWSGNAWFAGDVYVGSTSGTNKDDGSKKLATEDYVKEFIESNPPKITETDPTVPAWAKQPEKPAYTAAEVHALPDTYTPPVDAALSETSTNPVQNKVVAAKLSEVESIAKGRATGHVFETETDMRTWIAANASALNLGDNLYIRATDVPDYWWDGTSAQPMETQKVDLTEYAKKSEVPAVDTTLTQSGQAADAAAVGQELSSLSQEKVSLPKDADGNAITGTAGWYAVSDGAGGITWVESAPSTGGGGETTTHGIVWDLVNVTSSNNAVSVADGASLVAVLTPADGYTLGDVIVTMGGEVITGAWNADTATVTIQSVTGDVVISCAGVEQGTGEVIDTSPVIAHSGYAYRSVSTTSPNVTLTAKAGMCVTKIYEFTPNVAAIEAHPSYDADLGYINFPNQIGMFTSFLPNQKYLESGATDPGNTYKKAAYFVDGELQKTIYDNLTTQSAEGTSAGGLAKNVLQKSVNGIAFTLFEADAEDSYAYWTKTNSAGTYQENAVLPVGVNDGDIIFAGKNTPYYGMTNINGTTGGGTASVSELSFDDDVAQNYAVANASILGEDTAADPKTEYGISSELAAVIDEVRTAWMTEYGGDYRKIPLVITTDQHNRTNSGIFNMLGKTLSLHDVSKVMNLGDTVSVEWYDEDTTKPLVSCAQLEKWCKSIKEIPFSKRLDVYGNHDTWYGNYDDAGNTIGTRYPANQSHLDQYFRNIYARRNNNNGWFVIRDDYFNVKYVVVSGFEYDGGVTFRIGTKQMQFIIDEFSKNDGYDIVVVSHVPLYYQPSTEVYPTGMTPSDAGSETISRVSNVDTDVLFNGRKNKTSGSVTDSDGVEHTFDFSGCTTDILCGLHGHIHMDAYNYVGGNGLMSATFDWFDGSTIHFVLVDRINRQMNIWKVEGDALTYQNYQVPLDKPA